MGFNLGFKGLKHYVLLENTEPYRELLATILASGYP